MESSLETSADVPCFSTDVRTSTKQKYGLVSSESRSSPDYGVLLHIMACLLLEIIEPKIDDPFYANYSFITVKILTFWRGVPKITMSE